MSFTAAADSYVATFWRAAREVDPGVRGEQARAGVRDACGAGLPDGPFTLTARAWYARGTVPGEGVE